MIEPTYNDERGRVVYCGDALDVLRQLDSESVHCAITSPPYWGLRDYSACGCSQQRHASKSALEMCRTIVPGASGQSSATDPRCFKTPDPDCPNCGGTGRIIGMENQLGLEQSPAEYVAKMVEVFEEVRRVLRSDGVLFCNLGDSYATGTTSERKPTQTGKHGYWENPQINMRIDGRSYGLKPKDLCGIPWQVAFALRDAGWWLRQDIIWSKPAPMPESVRDRCCKSHEYIFLLSKSPRYFFDAEAIAEPSTISSGWAKQRESGVDTWAYGRAAGGTGVNNTNGIGGTFGTAGKRTKRSVWTVNSEPYPAAHFATFPRKLVEPMILAGCPEQCCAACGAPWVREVQVESKPNAPCNDGKHDGTLYRTYSGGVWNDRRNKTDIGFAPTCKCNADTVPGVVLDPFVGSGTTLQVARDLGRHAIGVELNPSYIDLCSKRLQQAVLF